MALTDQWRERRAAAMKVRPEVIERDLVKAAEACGQLPDQERRELADKLADAAMGHLRQSQELARLATKVRTGER